MINNENGLRRVVSYGRLEIIFGEKWILARCHQFNEPVIGHILKMGTLANKEIAWWLCPACNHQHFDLTEDK